MVAQHRAYARPRSSTAATPVNLAAAIAQKQKPRWPVIGHSWLPDWNERRSPGIESATAGTLLRSFQTGSLGGSDLVAEDCWS